MEMINLFIIVIYALSFLNCESIQIERVLIYSLPMNSDYYGAISSEIIKSHSSVLIESVQNNTFEKELYRFMNDIKQKQTSIQDNFIDVRVNIEIFFSNGEELEISFDRFGDFIYKGIVYAKDERILKCIEEYTTIKWNSIIYEK